MLIFIPNIITAGNLFCGLFAIFFAIYDNALLAVCLVFLGMFFDFLDGKIARLTGTVSKMGGYLDSFADVITFGVAPVIITYFVCPQEYRQEILLFFFLYAVCGISRLIRYTFNTKIIKGETFFGLPIPAAAGIIVSLMLICIQGEISFPFTFVVGVIVLSAILMVSTLPYQHFSNIIETLPRYTKIILVVLFLAVSLSRYYYSVLFLFFTLYAVFGIKRRRFAQAKTT